MCSESRNVCEVVNLNRVHLNCCRCRVNCELHITRASVVALASDCYGRLSCNKVVGVAKFIVGAFNEFFVAELRSNGRLNVFASVGFSCNVSNCDVGAFNVDALLRNLNAANWTIDVGIAEAFVSFNIVVNVIFASIDACWELLNEVAS